MSSTWSHLTCPPQPPFPIPISDDVFLPISLHTPIRTSISEPSLNFQLKGLNFLNKDEGGKEIVKVQEIKMKRRNTLLMTPGEVHRLGTIIISAPNRFQSTSKLASNELNTFKPLPKTPKPNRRVASDISTPSSTNSKFEDDSENDDVLCSSSSKGMNDMIDGLPSRKGMDNPIKVWRSPITTTRHHDTSSPNPMINEQDDRKVKRRRVTQIEWEGMPCPEALISPGTRQRFEELSHGFSWTSLD
ncbi:uncharacterized protein I206_102022 [Kwoniella pini CBS 10737]|uniref:Uncharacterized protein n=1 Tax=Kwoniella pini CBS 10737 TaxID=1296096 RepID=A0A1B9HV12_9TREE|nr:uncharacterized protein I206_06886 [Kwoniella pini CBS 10737]OCF47110.1 hypothetical protein I206_06886 [Kwoniella pini CBS 10737]